MNTYKKYAANVYIALCNERHEKGSKIIVETRRGKENESIVFNYLGKNREGKFMHSIIRSDGYNVQERAKNKAERYKTWSESADKKSTQYYEASQEGRDFLSLGEPIKIGHHSESRHRNLIERNWNRMGKSVEFSEKAVKHVQKAEYWEGKENEINLSMPESLEYYEFKLMEAKENHKDLKENPENRRHSYSLTYAKKEVNNQLKNVELAVRLWGTDEEIQQYNKEQEEENKQKLSKKSKKISFDDLLKKYGGFFFFGSDVQEFKDKYADLVRNGFLQENEKVTHITAGLYIPVKHKDIFIKSL